MQEETRDCAEALPKAKVLAYKASFEQDYELHLIEPLGQPVRIECKFAAEEVKK